MPTRQPSKLMWYNSYLSRTTPASYVRVHPCFIAPAIPLVPALLLYLTQVFVFINFTINVLAYPYT